jgi:hypothetical protein
MSPPPFPAEYRASGILLHVTSLPSPYGIGDVGPAAVTWVDRLHEAKQSCGRSLRDLTQASARSASLETPPTDASMVAAS